MRPERKKYQRAWAQSPAGRRGYLKRHYGITQEEYDAMLIKQAGGCAICGKPPLDVKFLSVDHNHQTGKVRGLLCRKCNLAIGILQDDPSLLRRAVNYLT